jgi:hypothetical protein
MLTGVPLEEGTKSVEADDTTGIMAMPLEELTAVPTALEIPETVALAVPVAAPVSPALRSGEAATDDEMADGETVRLEPEMIVDNPTMIPVGDELADTSLVGEAAEDDGCNTVAGALPLDPATAEEDAGLAAGTIDMPEEEAVAVGDDAGMMESGSPLEEASALLVAGTRVATEDEASTELTTESIDDAGVEADRSLEASTLLLAGTRVAIEDEMDTLLVAGTSVATDDEASALLLAGTSVATDDEASRVLEAETAGAADEEASTLLLGGAIELEPVDATTETEDDGVVSTRTEAEIVAAELDESGATELETETTALEVAALEATGEETGADDANADEDTTAADAAGEETESDDANTDEDTPAADAAGEEDTGAADVVGEEAGATDVEAEEAEASDTNTEVDTEADESATEEEEVISDAGTGLTNAVDTMISVDVGLVVSVLDGNCVSDVLDTTVDTVALFTRFMCRGK